jgi:hypothetical protein
MCVGAFMRIAFLITGLGRAARANRSRRGGCMMQSEREVKQFVVRY